MDNAKIIKTLKSDVSEIETLGYKYNFNRVFCFGVYSVFLNVFITEGDSCFNKPIREIQFKTLKGINCFIVLLNNNFKTNLMECV